MIAPTRAAVQDAVREVAPELAALAREPAVPYLPEVVERWCDWTDEVLARPVPRVLVHGDLHGDNQVWAAGELRVVLDFENAGLGEPEYELRAFPGPGMGPGLELLTATMRHYEEQADRPLSAERIMAWHVRQTLGDALWRSEAGIPLPDRRSPTAWVDDIAARFRALGLTLFPPNAPDSLFLP